MIYYCSLAARAQGERDERGRAKAVQNYVNKHRKGKTMDSPTFKAALLGASAFGAGVLATFMYTNKSRPAHDPAPLKPAGTAPLKTAREVRCR